MRWKLLLRNISVNSPRIAVRSQWPWPLRVLVGLIGVALIAAAGIWGYDRWLARGGPDRGELMAEVEGLRAQVDALDAERDRLAADVLAAEGRIKVEQAAQEALLVRLKQAEADVARQREDLAFFESLLPGPKDVGRVVIRSFRVQPEAEPNHLRYRLLLQQGDKGDGEFEGTFELAVQLLSDGKVSELKLPDPSRDGIDRYPVAFRYYRRVEGVFEIPDGATIRSVRVKVMADGKTQAQQVIRM